MNEWFWVAIIFLAYFFVPKIWKSTTSSIDSSIADIKTKVNDIRETQLEAQRFWSLKNITRLIARGVITGLASFGAVQLVILLF